MKRRREKPCASTLPESKNPDFKLKNEKKQVCTGLIYWRWTTTTTTMTMTSDEDCGSKKLPIETHLQPFGKHDLIYIYIYSLYIQTEELAFSACIYLSEQE